MRILHFSLEMFHKCCGGPQSHQFSQPTTIIRHWVLCDNIRAEGLVCNRSTFLFCVEFTFSRRKPHCRDAKFLRILSVCLLRMFTNVYKCVQQRQQQARPLPIRWRRVCRHDMEPQHDAIHCVHPNAATIAFCTNVFQQLCSRVPSCCCPFVFDFSQ